MTLSVINSKIEEAETDLLAKASGSTHLIAVSKVQPNERVLNVLEARAMKYLVKIKFRKH